MFEVNILFSPFTENEPFSISKRVRRKDKITIYVYIRGGIKYFLSISVINYVFTSSDILNNKTRRSLDAEAKI